MRNQKGQGQRREEILDLLLINIKITEQFVRDPELYPPNIERPRVIKIHLQLSDKDAEKSIARTPLF